MRRKGIMMLVLLSLYFNQAKTQSKEKNISIETKEDHRYIAKGTLGTYATPPRLKNGEVNLEVLIEELKELHANTYNWLLRNGTDDLDGLKEFLPLAAKAGIRVWVTLLPPSEPPFSEPFRLDYNKWAVALAALSKKEPNLVAWSVDDFLNNRKRFTPDYVKEFLSTAKAINPELLFIPCCYYKYINEAFAKNYAPLLGGILFPYRAESEGANLKDPSLVRDEIKELKNRLGKKFPIIMDVYATAHSSLGSTTSGYVDKVISAGLHYADGIIIYTHQDPVKNAAKYKVIKEDYSRGFNGSGF